VATGVLARRNGGLRYNLSVPSNERLDRVLSQLALYEHPLLSFSAAAKGDGVEVTIQVRTPTTPVHAYTFEMHARDLDQPQFAWAFEQQLYASMHDYLVEMFTLNPKLHSSSDGRPR
jgi:hypothetical protein